MIIDSNNKRESIYLDSIYEILQDNFTLVLLGEIVKKFKDKEAQSALEEFISEFSPMLIYEAYKFFKDKKFIQEEHFFNSPELKKKIRQYRNCNVKREVAESSYIKEIAQKMGIALNEEIFDINIVLSKNRLNRFNFSNYIKQEDNTFFGSCYATNYEFSRVIFKSLTNLKDEDYNEILNVLILKINDKIKELEKKLSGKRYSYKSSQLFKNSKISENDKYFILYRYTILNILKILKTFFASAELSIELDEKIFLNPIKFFRKIYALEIEIIGNDIRSLKTEYSNVLLEKLDRTILSNNNQFYRINRAFRDNIHYEIIYKFDGDVKDIENLQEQYVNIVMQNMNNEMYLNIDDESNLLTKFLEKCNELNIDKSEIDENYEDYYTQFYFTGTIKRKENR